MEKDKEKRELADKADRYFAQGNKELSDKYNIEYAILCDEIKTKTQ